MQISAMWLRCDDGITRPVVEGRILGAHDRAHVERFLVDSGADRTVLSAAILESLSLPMNVSDNSALCGIGGQAASAIVTTVIEFLAEGATPVKFRGQFAAFTQADMVDLSVLGRDVLNHFDVILSRRNDEVLLLTPNHRYAVVSG